MVCKLTPKGVNIYIIANYCKDYTSETAEYIAKKLISYDNGFLPLSYAFSSTKKLSLMVS